MSLKSVELQVALPRTKDAGIQQNQLVQKPITDQESLAQEAIRQSELARKKASQTEPEDPLRNHKEGSSGQRGHQQTEKKSKAADLNEEEVNHPYKGKHIDLSL